MSAAERVPFKTRQVFSPARGCRKDKVRKEVVETTPLPLAHSLARETQIGADLQDVLDAWPTLPKALKAGILAMIAAALTDG